MESRVTRLEAGIYGMLGVVAEMHCVLAPPVAKLELVRDEEEQ